MTYNYLNLFFIDTNVDVKKFRIPKLETPFTTIQIHSLLTKENKIVVKTKDYSLIDDIPSKYILFEA